MNLPDLSRFDPNSWENVRKQVVADALGYQGALLLKQLHPEQSERIETIVAIAEDNLDNAIAKYVKKRQAELDSIERGG